MRATSVFSLPTEQSDARPAVACLLEQGLYLRATSDAPGNTVTHTWHGLIITDVVEIWHVHHGLVCEIRFTARWGPETCESDDPVDKVEAREPHPHRRETTIRIPPGPESVPWSLPTFGGFDWLGTLRYLADRWSEWGLATT